jgi:hypothetical protein
VSERSLASKLAERFLTGAVESIARAGAKAAESLAADTKKALETEAARAGGLENLIKETSCATWACRYRPSVRGGSGQARARAALLGEQGRRSDVRSDEERVIKGKGRGT